MTSGADDPYLPGLSPADLDRGAAPRHEQELFTVTVVRSPRRRKTVGARLVGGVLQVTVPNWMSRAEEHRWVKEMSARFRRKMVAERIALPERATTLARRYDLPRPHSIRWVDDMRTQWGSCTQSTAAIRLTTRLAAFPDWVVDYVIVHELAHIEVLAHDAEFWRLVHRYPKAERAIGYLIAKSGDEDVD